MRKLLNILGVAAAVLIMSSIDSITSLIFSNPISAFFAEVIMFFFVAFIVAIFAITVKRFMSAIERNLD